MPASLIAENKLAVPCTPVSLALVCDAQNPGLYALEFPPQQIVFNRNDAKAIADLDFNAALPLVLGCTKISIPPQDGISEPVPLPVPVRITVADIDDLTGEAVALTTGWLTHTIAQTIGLFGLNFRFRLESGVLPLASGSQDFRGCRFVVMIGSSIPLRDKIKLCNLPKSPCDELCGRSNVCTTNQPFIVCDPQSSVPGDGIWILDVTGNPPFSTDAATSYKWEWVSGGTLVSLDENNPTPTLEVTGLNPGDKIVVTLTITYTKGTVIRVTKTLVYEGSPNVGGA
jgi:hypothetical protein